MCMRRPDYSGVRRVGGLTDIVRETPATRNQGGAVLDSLDSYCKGTWRTPRGISLRLHAAAASAPSRRLTRPWINSI